MGQSGIHDGHREKMRQRYLATHLEGFADHEVLEFLLFYAIPRINTNPLAHELINRFGNLKAVLDAPLEELMTVKGIKVQSAILIKLVSEMTAKAKMSNNGKKIVIDSVASAANYLTARLSGKQCEALYELCLNARGEVQACECLDDGTPSRVNLNMQKLVRAAILSQATDVILAHNHPSGNLIPSREDCMATASAKEILGELGITLQDHLIISGDDYLSLNRAGYMKDDAWRSGFLFK